MDFAFGFKILIPALINSAMPMIVYGKIGMIAKRIAKLPTTKISSNTITSGITPTNSPNTNIQNKKN